MYFYIGIYSCPMDHLHLVGLYTARLPVFRWKAKGYDWILADSIVQPSRLSKDSICIFCIKHRALNLLWSRVEVIYPRVVSAGCCGCSPTTDMVHDVPSRKHTADALSRLVKSTKVKPSFTTSYLGRRICTRNCTLCSICSSDNRRDREILISWQRVESCACLLAEYNGIWENLQRPLWWWVISCFTLARLCYEELELSSREATEKSSRLHLRGALRNC